MLVACRIPFSSSAWFAFLSSRLNSPLKIVAAPPADDALRSQYPFSPCGKTRTLLINRPNAIPLNLLLSFPLKWTPILKATPLLFMKELLIFLGLIAFYFALQLWILPKLGINTWMSGNCDVSVRDKKNPNTAASDHTNSAQKPISADTAKAPSSE